MILERRKSGCLVYAGSCVAKVRAALTLLSLLVAFHAPVVMAASESGMDCCPGGMPGMCCPLSGSCSLRNCGTSEREAQPSAMGAFLAPVSFAVMMPAIARLAPAGEPSLPFPVASRVPDPPPRG